MAHDPKLKAKVLKEWALGKSSIRDLEKKHGVPYSTIQEWTEESGQNRSAAEPKMSRYMEALEKFGVAAMNMLTSQAELLSDHSYLTKQSADDIIKQRESLLTGLERFVRLHRPLPVAEGNASLPGRSSDYEETIVPELVD